MSWPRFRRTILRTLVCVAVLATSGCVFLRLLELKNQLVDFEGNFSVDREDGLTITFLHPVMLEQDMWLLGLPPTTRESVSDEVIWTLIFEKLYPALPTESADFDLSVTLGFAEGKLAQFHLGEEYFSLIPKDAVLMTIKSLGQLQINTLGREAVLDIEESNGPEWNFTAPKKPDILATLGMPFLEDREDGISTLEYHYRLVPPVSHATAAQPEEPGSEYLLRIAFSKTDHILNVSGKLPLVGKVDINYNPPPVATNDLKQP